MTGRQASVTINVSDLASVSSSGEKYPDGPLARSTFTPAADEMDSMNRR